MTDAERQDLRITEEAAEWLLELRASGGSRHAEFFEWVRRSPEHVREFLAVTGLTRRLSAIDPQRQIDVEALLTRNGADIMPLPGVVNIATTSRRRRIAHWPLGLAAGLLILFAAGLWMLLKPESYATRIGEQRSLSLNDGSIIYLNTDSRVRVRFSDQAREVDLLAGEALFTVEHDMARPFRVHVGATTVQALGTQFDVYRRNRAETTVAVIQGAVVAGEVRLDAGEQASIHEDGKTAKATVADIDNVVAWRQRQLVFRHTPLPEVAAQFNRYNHRQIHIDAQTAQERQITGVFAADRPESFMQFVKRDEELEVRTTQAGWVVKSVH